MITEENKINFLIKIMSYMGIQDWKMVYFLKDWEYKLTKDEIAVLRKECYNHQLIDYLDEKS